MTVIRLLSPAKINLFLHITGRQEDGYHSLQTVFQLLDYGDDMTFSPAPAGTLAFHQAGSPKMGRMPAENNLVLRAARKLLAHAPNPPAGATIHLHKRIPAGAGLGGGSSNAATTLVALNRLWDLQLDLDQLAEIGLELGADVPVFVRGKSAWAEGVGERLAPLELPDATFVVITPACHVATARVFSAENLTRNSASIKIADFLAGRPCRNDCESVTRALYPEVDSLFRHLQKTGEVHMSGTGSSLFLRVADQHSGERLLQQLPDGCTGFVARAINDLGWQDKLAPV